MSKPNKTAADFMVIALSPVLIMALVGSLCFFLIEVFYRGKMMGGVCWVMFWFIIGIVLITRVAIETGRDRAAVLGLCLAIATWLYLAHSQPAYLLGVLLLAVVWFCAHQLVRDCTLIDEDQDSSGQGLLQPVAVPSAPKPVPGKKLTRKFSRSHTPGRWVIYFSLAALPLFGIGQMVLPADMAADRRAGFICVAVYLAAALGLLVTTSFLGLRRYLRQRYLKMPPSIALAWLKSGVGVTCIVLALAIFLPRPGAGAAWATLRYQIDYQLARASKYAAPNNPPGKEQGQPGSDSGGKEGNAKQPSQEQGDKQAAGQNNPSQPSGPPQNNPDAPALSGKAGSIYKLLRTGLFIVAGLLIGTWIIRRRYLLLALARSVVEAVRQFFRKLLEIPRYRRPAPKDEPISRQARFGSFAEYKNPFFATGEQLWPAEQIILYSYEAAQVWSREQGTAARPEETAREFCGRLREHHPELDAQLDQLARLYAHAAYGTKLPPDSDLEPIRDLWRQMPVYLERKAAMSRT